MPDSARPTPPVTGWDNPPAVAPRGTVIVIPGRGEHPGVYERFGIRIAFDGYQVRAVADPVAYPEESERQIQELLADENSPRPHVLVGSDSGALFAASLVAGSVLEETPSDVAGLILVGLPTRAAEAAGEAREWETELGARTACPTHQARLQADEQLTRGAVYTALPAGWFEAANLASIAIPVLGLHGDADSISPIGPVRDQFAKAPTAELVRIRDGRHDALNDATHRTAAATIVLFLERLRLGAAAPEIAHQE
jgi:pimeloyl-ACP methyl ester carboxylesterase